MYKQHCDEAMLQKLTTLPEWETEEEDMDRVGLTKVLRQLFHKKGAGENYQMPNIVQASKDDFMCWQ